MRKRQRRTVTLVVCDDRDNREGARRMLPNVITSESSGARESICSGKRCLHTVLLDVEDIQRGITLALLAVNVGSFYVGLISKTVPNELDRAVFSINGAMLSIDNEKRFPLDPTTEPDGIGNRDWRNLYRSLVTEGPAVISIPCRV